MKEQTSTLQIHSAVVSDRGLSEKRPLNEDSYLADPARYIFAVADGVGGANAGEVASQTAIEVLDDAFRNQEDGADIEDLMELAIQRANASIHQMAHEHPKLAAMATTVVALHLDGQIATIGHVGDSRLYRLTPDGKLHRDTADHSVVEEEVRAGRMTPEQAAHHPSRNVISRALGAEASVEVDMKILEVEEGTAFLLCSDGITRHLPDNELRDILSSYRDLEEACTEMKRRCYERGAEDNLTAVVVRVGNPPGGGVAAGSLAETSELHDTLPGLARGTGAAGATQSSAAALMPPSRVAFPASADGASAAPPAVASAPSQNSAGATSPPPHAAQRNRAASFGRALLLLLLVAGVGAAAFYAGQYQAKRVVAAATNSNINANANISPTPTPTPVAIAENDLDNRRREIDRDPASSVSRMDKEVIGKPLDTFDPEYLYLYGRALLYTNRYEEASRVFRAAEEKMKERPGRDTLKVETKMAAVISAMRSNNLAATQAAAKDLDEAFEAVNKPVTQPLSNLNAPANVSNSGDPAATPQQ
jgi:serine/threonine protein phosphatase PrpC